MASARKQSSPDPRCKAWLDAYIHCGHEVEKAAQHIQHNKPYYSTKNLRRDIEGVAKKTVMEECENAVQRSLHYTVPVVLANPRTFPGGMGSMWVCSVRVYYDKEKKQGVHMVTTLAST